MNPDKAITANIRRVAHPRGDLSNETLARITEALEQQAASDAHLRAVVVEALQEGSFRAVHEATGLSTNTLQRWKREA